MSDGITDARKKIAEEKLLKIEAYRIVFMINELKQAKISYKQQKKAYKRKLRKINKEKKSKWHFLNRKHGDYQKL